MKILFISMHSIHAKRWIENLIDSGHELYWFDILKKGHFDLNQEVKQFSFPKVRKIPYIKGEFFLEKKLPQLYKVIQPFLKITPNEELDRIIQEINPDIIHSFEMQSCSYPILKTMNKYRCIKWIYSCWGSDIYYYKNLSTHKNKIYNILKRVNVLHTDCMRDYDLACELGFLGEHTGVIPGGTGFKLEEFEAYKQDFNTRNIILVKGYNHGFGRGLNIIKALENCLNLLQSKNLEVYVFGAHSIVQDYIKQKKLPFKVFGRNDLKHEDVLKLMGKSKIYIGNSISDGMPNTLLEAIVMGVFPIQSNPGNVTSEIIKHQVNGLCIKQPENILEIQAHIEFTLSNTATLKNAQCINAEIANEKLEFKKIKQKILNIYS